MIESEEKFRAGADADLDIIDIVTARVESLSQSERRIGAMLLENPAEFSQLGIKDIAGRAGVSEPTVVRFCKNVGCRGFKDLKFRLVQDVAIRQAATDAKADQQSAAANRPSFQPTNLIERCCLDAERAIHSVSESLDMKTLQGVVGEICASKKVVIYGLGGSSAVMASELHNRLFRLGLNSVAYLDSYLQRMSAATVAKGDVAIFISSTGRPRALLDSVELAKYYGAICVGISPQDSMLAAQVDHCLDVRLSQSGVDLFQPNPMRFAQLLVIDILAFEIANQLGDSAADNLKRSRASIASLHGIAPQQPIGD